GVGQRHVALDHVECGVAQDALQTEGVATVDQVRPGEGVAQGVGAAAAGQPSPQLQPAEELLDTATAQRAAETRAKDRAFRISTSLTQVADQRLAGDAAPRAD